MSQNDNNKKELAESLKMQGNECFKEKRFYKAIDFYTKALDEWLSSVVLSNRAQAYLNLHKFEQAYTDSNEALLLDSNNLKALYRRAISLYKIGFNAKAINDLKKCIKIDQQNQEAKNLLKTIEMSNKIDKSIVDVTYFRKSEFIQSNKPLKKCKIISKQIFDNKKINNEEKKLIDENDFDIINPSEFSKLSVNDNQIEADTSFDVSLLPPPAKNFNQFLRVWVELNTEPIKFAHYFLSLDLDLFSILFDNLVDLEILNVLINGLYNGQLQSERALHSLIKLSQTKRFNISVVFLDDCPKQELNVFLSRFNSVYEKEINEIRKQYML